MTYTPDFNKVIIEDSSSARKNQLNNEITRLLKLSDQKVVGKIKNDLFYGKFVGFDGEKK